MEAIENQHPMLLYAGSGCPDLAAKIAGYVDQPLCPADTTPHPCGETMVRVLEKARFNVRSRDVFVMQSVCRQWNPTAEQPYTGINDMVMELCVWGNLLRLASAHTIVAVIPYFGYARQDRKNASRTPITARLLVDLLQTAGFDRVLTMDLHAPQIQGFFDPKQCILDHLNAGSVIVEYFNSLDLKNPVILCPDLGNVKKADKYRAVLPPEVEMAIIDKRRDPDTGKVTGIHFIGDVRDRDVFLTDDIISTAGTMAEAINIACDHGAKRFFIAATHGECIGPAIKRLSHPKIKEVAVTNTIPVSAEMRELPLKILGVEKLFGEAMVRIHRGESISELLGPFG